MASSGSDAGTARSRSKTPWRSGPASTRPTRETTEQESRQARERRCLVIRVEEHERVPGIDRQHGAGDGRPLRQRRRPRDDERHLALDEQPCKRCQLRVNGTFDDQPGEVRVYARAPVWVSACEPSRMSTRWRSVGRGRRPTGFCPTTIRSTSLDERDMARIDCAAADARPAFQTGEPCQMTSIRLTSTVAARPRMGAPFGGPDAGDLCPS